MSIEHRLDLGWPVIGGFAAEHVVGPQFIEAIAGRTLRTHPRAGGGAADEPRAS